MVRRRPARAARRAREPTFAHPSCTRLVFVRTGISPIEGASMKHSFFLVIALLALLAAPVAAQEASPVASPTTGAPSAVASGLVNPRGFLWTDNGMLFVA